MNIIFIGPPGSGKGTQANWLSKHYAIAHLATGDMLRSALSCPSPLSHPIQTTLENGQLVPDELVMKLIQARVSHTDCKKGFILDGFPRTLTQAEMLQAENIQIHHIFEFVVPTEALIERFSGRRIHLASGRVYHLRYNPPKIETKDDVTGEPLIQRPDDNEATIQKRLKIYYEDTQKVTQYYQTYSKSKDPLAPQYHILKGDDDIETIRRYITSLIEKN